MTDIHFPIVDLFTSIQGEGKYAGQPSIFIRTTGCNLKCVFGDSICDTPYSSFKPELSKYSAEDVINVIKENPRIHHIVITGGEPTLYQSHLYQLLQYIESYFEDDENINIYSYIITIETNGTRGITEDGLLDYVDLWSISPKLHTSIPKPGQVVETLNESFVFGENDVKHYDKERKNSALLALLIIAGSDVQLKFVYSGEDSYNEIREWVAEIQQIVDSALEEDEAGYEINVNDYVMLMPEGVNEEMLQKHRREAAEICVKEGWSYTDRLHITIWGDMRGF